MTPRILLLALTLSVSSASALAQKLDARFSCSNARTEAGEKTIYADSGEFRLNGSKIESLRWESSLFRSTHGFDCSIDQSDGPLAEAREEGSNASWRISLKDAPAARFQRGFDFGRRLNCTIRLERDGDTLNVKPTCPALCGSRENFTEFSIDLKSGQCRYEE